MKGINLLMMIIKKAKFSIAGNRKDYSPKHSRATFSSFNLNFVGTVISILPTINVIYTFGGGRW